LESKQFSLGKLDFLKNWHFRERLADRDKFIFPVGNLQFPSQEIALSAGKT
jgi:hypothetical protein